MTEHKSKRQRAQEALATEERKVERLQARKAKLEAQVAAVNEELTAGKARVQYLAANPDLGEQE